MSDFAQEYKRHGAPKRVEAYCKVCEAPKPFIYVGTQKAVPEDMRPFFMYNCVSCFGTKAVQANEGQLEKILREAKNEN